MTRLTRTMITCTLATILLQGITAQAGTYYVATAGSDSNPGTISKPWRTVAYAVSRMGAGDTTYVRDGVYFEATEVKFQVTGTQSAPIKLLNYPGESPVIDFSLATGGLRRVIILNSQGSNRAIGWITIEGFEIRNGNTGIHYFNLHDAVIRRNWIHHNTPGQGILGGATRILIDRNRINHNGNFSACLSTGAECGLDHGIYAGGTDYTVTNNLIYDNLAFGIQVAAAYTYDPAKYAGPEYVHSSNWVIANNTFAYSSNKSGIVLWGSTCNNTRIENNIFYENGVRLVPGNVNGVEFVATSCTGIQIRNNLSYASGSGATAFLGTRATEGVHYVQSGNIVNTINPGFVNAPATLPASPNFALTEHSPAIDRGVPLPDETRPTAFDGTPRPQGPAYDIGAYEYSPTGDTHGPSQVQNLQLH